MASITIRNINDAVKNSARLAAAKKGRSLEAEIRALLERTYAPSKADRASRIRAMSGDDWVHELIAMAGGANLELPDRIEKFDREVFGAG